MREAQRKRLEAAGWRLGSAADFLGLSAAEATLVDLKLALADALAAHRRQRKLTQAQLATRMGSSQSRVAKMEAADPRVSLDLLIWGLLAAGASRRDLARIVDAPRR